MKIGFDIISDLNLKPDNNFDWSDKVTSLYCIIAGNISTDLHVVQQTLNKISSYYQGVFYIPGFLEYETATDFESRTKELTRICKRINGVALLYQHVVIVDGIAVVACNGWFDYSENLIESNLENMKSLQIEDMHYLKNTIEKLQKHLDVMKIVIVTNSVPNPNLYFGEIPKFVETRIPLNIVLMSDTMKKVSHWVFGSYEKIVDTEHNGINYLNNPCYGKNPYWAKRIDVET